MKAECENPIPRCVFCTYELVQPTRGSEVRLAPEATCIIDTPNGPREVCQRHAIAKTWEHRT